jgi:hypothetical protein
MTTRIELIESLNYKGGIFAGIAGRSEGPYIDGMLHMMESQMDMGLGFAKRFLVEGTAYSRCSYGYGNGSSSCRSGMAAMSRRGINQGIRQIGERFRIL